MNKADIATNGLHNFGLITEGVIIAETGECVDMMVVYSNGGEIWDGTPADMTRDEVYRIGFHVQAGYFVAYAKTNYKCGQFERAVKWHALHRRR